MSSFLSSQLLVASLFSFLPLSSLFVLLIYCFRPNGKTFTVPRDDVHVPRPSLGDIVSFSYRENARLDLPTRPSVFRIRTDIDWEDVTATALSDRHCLSGKLGERKRDNERGGERRGR